MPLTILSDTDVRTLLLQLTKEDIYDLQSSLADALHYYSTATEEDHNGCCSTLQPLRTALKRSDGQTTLYVIRDTTPRSVEARSYPSSTLNSCTQPQKLYSTVPKH